MVYLRVALVGPALTQAGGPVLVESKVEEAVPQILEGKMPEAPAQQEALGGQAQPAKQQFLNHQ